MLNADVIFGSVSAIIGAIWIVMSLPFPKGTSDGVPGPGYFPILIASLLIIASVTLIFSGLKSRKSYFDVKKWSKKNVRMFFLSWAIMLLFLMLWLKISYIIACLVLTFGLGLVFEINLKENILISPALTFATYYVFNNLLNILLNFRR